MNLPYIDRIWRVRGSLPLDARERPAEAFAKLDPLFQTAGTSYRIDGDTLTFSKKNPAAQDKLATFNRGTLRVVERGGRSGLVYDLTSPALLLCFLAPLLFLGFAQLTIAVGELEKASPEAAETAKKDKKEQVELPQHPLDKALGAPAPEKPKPEGKEKDEEQDKGPSPTPAYVFAAIFAVLYVVGRILEDRLVRRLFKRGLQPHAFGEAASPGGHSSSAAPAGT